MKKLKRIAVLTGGGDCPGLNAVIRAVTKKAISQHTMKVIGIEDGYEGLIKNKHRELSNYDVSGILTLGGTILGTSNKANPYNFIESRSKDKTPRDVSKQTLKNIQKLELDCLVCIGGDGTLRIANRLFKDGVPVVGVPKTIDNDIIGTQVSFGFNTAVEIVTEAIDRIHTTAQSHHRVMIIEVMGRTAGWIALYSGVAGGGDIILIPEIPFTLDSIAKKVTERSKRGKRFSIVVVAEGAKPKGGDVVIRKLVDDASEPVRLGGIGFVLSEQIEKLTGIETRTVVLGHLQRGGTPTAYDRVLATQLGAKVVDMITAGHFGHMVGVQGNDFVEVPLTSVAQGSRLVEPNHPLIQSARATGICFGD